MYDTDEVVNVCAAVVRANETRLAVKLSNFSGALQIGFLLRPDFQLKQRNLRGSRLDVMLTKVL